MKGKRINAGLPQSEQYRAVETILQAKGWSKGDFSLFGDLPPSQSQDDVKAFCYGTMQAMVYVGVHPDFSLRHLLEKCNADLLNIDDQEIVSSIETNPAYWLEVIPGGLYPTHPAAVKTIGTRAVLLVSEDFDAETSYRLIDALLQNRARLIAAHPAFALFSLDGVRSGGPQGIAAHEGVQRYLAEHP